MESISIQISTDFNRLFDGSNPILSAVLSCMWHDSDRPNLTARVPVGPHRSRDYELKEK